MTSAESDTEGLSDAASETDMSQGATGEIQDGNNDAPETGENLTTDRETPTSSATMLNNEKEGKDDTTGMGNRDQGRAKGAQNTDDNAIHC